MQAFSLDRESAIPVKLQIKAHVKYQIATGLLYPGDQLPPLRDLAAGLGINLNTVIRAVDELITEGYLYSHQGKGVFVAEEPPGQVPGAALRSLLAGVLGPTRDWGLSPEEAALALLAQAHLARTPQPAAHRLLLVGTSRTELRLLQRELEAALPSVAVVSSLPEEVGRPTAFKVVACTLFHGHQLPPGVRRVALAGPAEQEALERLRRLPPGAPVVIAAGDWVQAARIRQSFEAGGLGHLRFHLAARPAELAEALPGAAGLVAAQSGRRMAEEVLAAHPAAPPLLVEPLQVPQEVLAAIRQGLGSPAREQRVQLRSSWV
ncbi:MAG: GntR family transcriptional regulator [Bacillota bacterium]